MTEGEGAFFPSLFLAVSRALRMASQRASICRFAGTTRPSLRVIVGESAGSREIVRVTSAIGTALADASSGETSAAASI